MKFVLLAIVLMAVVPPTEAHAYLLPVLVAVGLLLWLGRRPFPTFESLTANRDMSRAVDDRVGPVEP